MPFFVFFAIRKFVFFLHVLVDSVFTAPGPILMDLMVILEAVFQLLGHISCRCCESEKSNLSPAKCLFLRRPGFHFSMFLGTFFQFVFEKFSGRHFLVFFIDFELKMDSRGVSSWRDFGTCLMSKKMTKFGWFFSRFGDGTAEGVGPLGVFRF